MLGARQMTSIVHQHDLAHRKPSATGANKLVKAQPSQLREFYDLAWTPTLSCTSSSHDSASALNEGNLGL